MQVLNCFAQEMDFNGMHIDIALRKFQTYFRMPGEAQKIERLMQVFSGRYCQCNREFLATLHSSDTVFILAFAIILLNTDLHTPNIKVNYSQFFLMCKACQVCVNSQLCGIFSKQTLPMYHFRVIIRIPICYKRSSPFIIVPLQSQGKEGGYGRRRWNLRKQKGRHQQLEKAKIMK